MARSAVTFSRENSVRESVAAGGSSDALTAVISNGYTFAQHVRANCNRPPDTRNNSGGFENLLQGFDPGDMAGGFGAPLGFSSGASASNKTEDMRKAGATGASAPGLAAQGSFNWQATPSIASKTAPGGVPGLPTPNKLIKIAEAALNISHQDDGKDGKEEPRKPGWVVREVSVQAGSVAILYDRELPTLAEPSSAGTFDTLLTHDILRRPINDDNVERDCVFYAWLYNQTGLVESAMRYFAVPLNRYLRCRCDDCSQREVLVDFKKAKPGRFIKRTETGELKFIDTIPHKDNHIEIKGYTDLKDCFSIHAEVVDGEQLDEGDTVMAIDWSSAPTVGQIVPRWEANPAINEQRLENLKGSQVRLRVQKSKENMQHKFDGLVHQSLRCDFLPGDALTFCAEVECSFTGLALIGDMTGSVQLEAWGDADKRDLRSMNIADRAGDSGVPHFRDRVIMLTFVPKGQPIRGRRLRLRLLKGKIVLTKIGIFGITKQRTSKTAVDIMPDHEAFDFLFSDALTPKQRTKATLIAEQRERGVRRLLQFIPSLERSFRRQYEAARSLEEIRVRCICCFRFGAAANPSSSDRKSERKSETRTFHAHSRYWLGCADGYFDARRDPMEGFNPEYGEQPWAEAFQLHFRGVSVSPCGSRVAAITHQRFAVWSLADGKLLDSQIVRSLGNMNQPSLGTPPRVLKSLAWRQVGGDKRTNCLILGCTNGDILVFEGSWDDGSLELRCVIEGMHNDSIALITMTLDNNFVVTASPPKGDSYNMSCFIWPFWEITARDGRRDTQKHQQGMCKQITLLSKDLDICERTAAQQILNCQLHDTLREKVVRWAATMNMSSREHANYLSKFGLGEKEFQRRIDAARKSQTKVVNSVRQLALLIESLKIDANVNMSEKHELVMDEEDDDVLRVLQILVLSHYQVAMLCLKAVRDEDKLRGQEPYLSMCVWSLGDERQISPTSEFQFPKQWVHPGTTACVVSSCPSIIACVPDKGLVLCELIRDCSADDRKKTDNVLAPYLTFASLQTKFFRHYPLSSMVVLANGLFEDIPELECEGKIQIRKQTSTNEDTGSLSRGISPDLLVAVIAPEDTGGPSDQDDWFDSRVKFQQVQKIDVDVLLKCFKVVDEMEYRFSKPLDVLADGETEGVQVQALNNMSDPPTFLLKCVSGDHRRVEVWPSPSAEVKGTIEPVWEDLLADHESINADPEAATEDEAKTTASEGQKHVEYYEFNFAPKGRSKIDIHRNRQPSIHFPYSRGTSRKTIGFSEGVIVAQIPEDAVQPRLHTNEAVRLRAYYETPVAQDSLGRSVVVSTKVQQQDLPVMISDATVPLVVHNVLVEPKRHENAEIASDLVNFPKGWKLLDDQCCPQDSDISFDFSTLDQYWYKRFRVTVALHSEKHLNELHVLVNVDVIICGKLEGVIGGSVVNSAQVFVQYEEICLPGLYGLGHYGAVGFGHYKKRVVLEDSTPQQISLVQGGVCALGKWKLDTGDERTGLVFIDERTGVKAWTEEDVIKVPESDGGWQVRCAEQHGDPFVLLWKPRCAQTALYYYPVPSDDDAPSTLFGESRGVVPFMNMEDKVKVLAVLETSHGVVYSTTSDLFFFKSDSINHWINQKSSKLVKNAKHIFGDRNKRRQEMYNTQVVTKAEFSSHDIVKNKDVDTLQCRATMSLVAVHRDVFAASFEQSFTVLFFQFAGGENNYIVMHQQIQVPYMMRPYEVVEQKVKGKKGRKAQRPTRFLKLGFNTGFDKQALENGVDPNNRPLMPFLLGFSSSVKARAADESTKKMFCIATTQSIYFVPLPRVKHDFLLESTKVPIPQPSLMQAPVREGPSAARGTRIDLNGGGAINHEDSTISLPPMLATGVVTPICANIFHHINGDWYVDCVMFHANIHTRILFAQGDVQQMGDITEAAQAAQGDMGGGISKPQAIAVFEPPSGSKDRPAVFVLTSSDIKMCAITEQAKEGAKAEEWITIASWVDDINEHTSRWDGMLVSPDGRHIAAYATTGSKSGKDQEVALKIWDSVAREVNWDGRDRQMMPTVKCACFSEDSKFFVYCTSPTFRNRVYVIAADTALPEVKWGSGVEYVLHDQEEFYRCLSGTDAEASRGTDHVILMSTHQRLFYQSLNSPLHFTITPPWLTSPSSILSLQTLDKSDVDGGDESDADQRDRDANLKVYSQKKLKGGNKGMLEQFHRKGLRDCGLHSKLEVPDDAFTASSYKENYDPHFARIAGHVGSQVSQRARQSLQAEQNNQGWMSGFVLSPEEPEVGRLGSWWKPDPQIVGQNIRGQWLQVDLGARFWVRGMRIQGKQQSYVRKFGVQLSTEALSTQGDALYMPGEVENYELIEENSEDQELPLNYSEVLEDLFEKLDVNRAAADEVDDDYDDERDLHDAWFILPEAVEARFVCIEPYDQGGTHESVPGIRIEVYHQVPQLMAFNSADRHGQRYDLYYKTPETQTRTKLSKLSIAIANKMTLHDLFAAFHYKTKDRKAMRQGLQIDLAKFQLLRCALYKSDQNNCLTQVQSASERLDSAHDTRGTDRVVLGLGYGQCYWSLLHELCNGDDQHDRLLSWLVEVGDEAVPEEASYLARMLVPAHLLVHSVVPWAWAKELRNEMRTRSATQLQYALFRPLDVMVHKVHNDWGHNVNLADTLDRVVTQLVRVGEEGWWHLRGLIDELPIEMVMGIDAESLLLAVKSKERQQETSITSKYSLAHLDVKTLGPVKEHSGMVELLVTIPNILGDPEKPKDSLLYRSTHPDVRNQMARDGYYEKLEAFCGTQIVKIIIKYKWEQYVQYLFKLGFFVYVLYLCLFTAVSMQFAHLPEDKDPIFDVLGAPVLLCTTFLYAIMEIFYLIVERKTSYFWGEEGLWNYCDWIIIVLTATTFWYMRAGYEDKKVEHRELALSLCSTCSIFVWLRSVYFAQGFKEWGQFVHVVFFIFRDSGYFLAMLLVILFGFAHGMYLFFRRDPNVEPPENFESFSMTLTTCYSMMVGELPLDELKEHWLTLVYFFVFIALVSITLLNVLIAKMNDSYANTMSRAQGKYSLSLATQIASLEVSFSWIIRWKFRHCFGTWLCSRQRQEMHTDEETQQSIRIIDEHCEKLLADLEQKFTHLTRSAQQVLENATAQQMINQSTSRDVLDHFERTTQGGVLGQDQVRDIVDQAMRDPASDLLWIKNVLERALQGAQAVQKSDKNSEGDVQQIEKTHPRLKVPRGAARATNSDRLQSFARMTRGGFSPRSQMVEKGEKLDGSKTLMDFALGVDSNKPRVRISALEGCSDGSCKSSDIQVSDSEIHGGSQPDWEREFKKDPKDPNMAHLAFQNASSIVIPNEALKLEGGMSELLLPPSLLNKEESPEVEFLDDKQVRRTSFGSLLEPESEFFEDHHPASSSMAPNLLLQTLAESAPKKAPEDRRSEKKVKKMKARLKMTPVPSREWSPSKE